MTGTAGHEPEVAGGPSAPWQALLPLPSLEDALRGISLAGLALTLARAARSLWRRAGLIALPAIAVLGAGAFLAGWAALIHLTGGERFDDHPFV